MADSRFFNRAQPISLAKLAELVQAEVSAEHGELEIEDVASLSEGGDKHVSFLDNIKYKSDFLSTRAAAVFVNEELAVLAPDGCVPLVSKNPYKSYALAASYFYPQPQPEAHISQQAVIAEGVELGEGCRVDAGAIIGEGAQIGEGSWIEAGAVIGPNVVIGKYCRIGSNANVSHALIGDYVRLYPGVCAGQDGFGFAIDPAGHVKVPQLGRVIIEDHVEIGANTTIDRGAGPDTVIGQGSWIDNLVQIGHNVKIGKGCVIVSQAGISGSTVLEDYVVLAGQVGVAGHLHIGKGARIAAKSGLMKDIPAGEEHMGYPALPIKDFMRQVATLNRLIRKKK